MKYKLKILSLKCYLPDEKDGDDIYLMSGGSKMWPPNKKFLTIADEDTPIGIELNISKGDRIPIELWDHDNLSANDHLGKLVIEADSHGRFIVEFIKMAKDKSRYALEWEIG